MKTILSLLTPIILLLIWFLISYFNLINPLFLPSPQEVFVKLYKLMVSGEVFPDIIATLLRVLVGFFMAIFIGVPIGLIMGSSRRIYQALEFIIDFLRSIPAMALFPLFLLFFGIGNTAKIAVVVFACSLIIIINTVYGVRHGKELRIMVAKTMKANRFNLFRKVILPEALPEIVGGLRIAISLSLIIVIVTEMFIGTKVGLGHRIFDAQLVYRIPEMYAVIILTGCLGYLINKLFSAGERKVVHWSGK